MRAEWVASETRVAEEHAMLGFVGVLVQIVIVGRTGVCLTFSKSSDSRLLRTVGSEIQETSQEQIDRARCHVPRADYQGNRHAFK